MIMDLNINIGGCGTQFKKTFEEVLKTSYFVCTVANRGGLSHHCPFLETHLDSPAQLQ